MLTHRALLQHSLALLIPFGPAPGHPAPAKAATQVSVTGLRAEYMANPIGLGTARPRLSWRLVTDARNTMQSAYEIQVATREADLARGTHLLWDSGRLASGRVGARAVRRAGAAVGHALLLARARVDRGRRFVRVEPGRRTGKPGCSHPADWTAKWIGTAPVPARQRRDALAAAAPAVPSAWPRPLGAALRHQPRPQRRLSERPPRGRRRVHARLDLVPEPAAVPDVRRHRARCATATTRWARCSATAGIAAIWASTTRATCTASIARCCCNSRCASTTAAPNASCRTEAGRPPTARCAARTSTTARPTTRGSTTRGGRRRRTTTRGGRR